MLLTTPKARLKHLRLIPGDAFILHNKPGSPKTLYLDFNGATLSGTQWNFDSGADPKTFPAFDLDGSAGTFSDSERNRIIEIWKRVAEDFAAFDIDVTTKEPSADKIARSSSSDQEYGTIALITRAFSPYSSAGGVAYVGVFNYTQEFYKPAMVFFDKLGNGNAKYTAEAISHEVGHNLSLQHDGSSIDGSAYYTGHGSGSTGWASIMGVGYYKNLTQWDKGEFNGATNSQDDIALMGNQGVVPRNDDHGNSRSAATFLNQGTTFGASGIVETRSDVDFFSFNAGTGTLELDAFVNSVGPNLDILLKVFNSNGQEIGRANPVDSLGASLAITLPADGVYFASVEGVGKGDLSTGYTDYASLGQYTIVGTVSDASGNTPPTAIVASDKTSGMAPLAVQFDGSQSADSDGTIVSYAWDFADGATSSAVSPSHVFEQPGTFSVSLVVTDDKGLQDVDSVSITVQDPPNQPPVAVINADKTSGKIPLVVNFSSANSYDSDGSISSYNWNFGDGATSSASNPSHTYNTPGTYNARLTVTDNEGANASATVSIVVQDDPTFLPEPVLSVNITDTTAALQWTDGSNNESGFKVYRREESGKGRNKSYSSWQLVNQSASNSTSYSDNNLAAGSTYEWYVEAWNSANSASSNVVSGRTSKSGGGSTDGGDTTGGGNNGKGGGKKR